MPVKRTKKGYSATYGGKTVKTKSKKAAMEVRKKYKKGKK